MSSCQIPSMRVLWLCTTPVRCACLRLLPRSPLLLAGRAAVSPRRPRRRRSLRRRAATDPCEAAHEILPPLSQRHAARTRVAATPRRPPAAAPHTATQLALTSRRAPRGSRSQFCLVCVGKGMVRRPNGVGNGLGRGMNLVGGLVS